MLGWSFLRLLLCLQSGSLSIGVPSSRLVKDERLILGHVCNYLSMKASRVVLRGVRLRKEPLTLYVLRNSLKYGRLTTLNIPPYRKVFMSCAYWATLLVTGQVAPEVISPKVMSPGTSVMLPESKSQVARSNNYIKDQTYGLCIGNKVEKSLSLKGLSDRRLN